MQGAAARPIVTIHYAQTLDGRIAARNGSSQWISSEPSLALSHRLRGSHAAVLVGINTILRDDPQLTVRLVPGKSPTRIILDSALRIPLEATVLRDHAAPTIVVTTGRAELERVDAVHRLGAEVIVAEADEQRRVDLAKLLWQLNEQGLDSILIEGGQQVITSALAHDLVDRVIVCIAPKLLGSGVQAVGDLDIPDLAHARSFAQSSFRQVGDDIIFEGQLRQPSR